MFATLRLAGVCALSAFPLKLLNRCSACIDYCCSYVGAADSAGFTRLLGTGRSQQPTGARDFPHRGKAEVP
jgi:hypothetical protein